MFPSTRHPQSKLCVCLLAEWHSRPPPPPSATTMPTAWTAIWEQKSVHSNRPPKTCFMTVYLLPPSFHLNKETKLYHICRKKKRENRQWNGNLRSHLSQPPPPTFKASFGFSTASASTFTRGSSFAGVLHSQLASSLNSQSFRALGLAVLEPLGGFDVLRGRLNIEGALGVLLVGLGRISAERLVLLRQASGRKEERKDGAKRCGTSEGGRGKK